MCWSSLTRKSCKHPLPPRRPLQHLHGDISRYPASVASSSGATPSTWALAPATSERLCHWRQHSLPACTRLAFRPETAPPSLASSLFPANPIPGSAYAAFKLASKPRTRGRRGRRAPAAAQAAAGRLPLGTPLPHLTGASHPHSHTHIRVIPRQELDSGAHEDLTPTFRSSSLQLPPVPLSDQESRRRSAASDASTKHTTTFADMARRFNKSDPVSVETSTGGPAVHSGFVAFQTHSSRVRLGNKTWRSAMPSDLVQGEGLDGFHGDSSSPVEASQQPTQPEPQAPPAKAQSTPFALPKLQTNIQVESKEPVKMAEASDQPTEHISNDSDDTSPTDTRPLALENYLRVFEHLPDIIRLQEQTGDFDGQVVFIGHPNRDVSAHQWLSDSYQWVHIGLWCHMRQRIEGSLASDRLSMSGFPFNSIEHFKFIAERREANIKENGRPKPVPETTATEPTTTDASTEDNSDTPESSFTLPSRPRSTVTGEKLEDPFVTPAGLAQPVPMVPFSFRGAAGGSSGMDFSYEFPSKLGSSNRENQQMYVQRERARLDALCRQSVAQSDSQTPLRDVGFGEEASTGPTPRSAQPASHRQDTLIPTIDLKDTIPLRTRRADLTPTLQPNLTLEQRVAIPDLPLTTANLRNSVPSGPTVANPYRGTSTLNAAAAPYRMPEEQPSETESSATAIGIQAAPTVDPTLRFSDPDVLKQGQSHSIANGFNRQAPTMQNWNGPFFADSMPTTLDPLASLAAQISHEQKLTDWYRDGQSVIRQQDYAKSLVAAASASASAINKARSIGVIGDGSARKQNLSKHANTHLFARVYEQLSVYADESRSGGERDYFTRAWKPSPLHLRDLGPDGNNSFYSDVPKPSPQVSREGSRTYQPYRGDRIPWGFGARASALGVSQYSSGNGFPTLFSGLQRRGI